MDRDAAHEIASMFVGGAEGEEEGDVSRSVSKDSRNAALDDLQDGVLPE
jgi:hypothetical protein